jgi:hypothetical protein
MSSPVLRNHLVMALQRGRIVALRHDGMDVALPKGEPYRRLRLRLSPRRLEILGQRRHPPLADLLDAAFDADAPPVFVRRERLFSLPLRSGRWAADPGERAIQVVLLLADVAGAPARVALGAFAEHVLALAGPGLDAGGVVVRVDGTTARIEGARLPEPIWVPGAGRRLARLRISTGADVWRHEAPLVLEISPMESSAHARAAARARPPMPAGLDGCIPRLDRIRAPRSPRRPGPGIAVDAALAPSARAAWSRLA